MNKSLLLLAAAAVWAAMIPSAARAQTSAALLLKPWDANGATENSTNGLLYDEGHVKETGNSFQLSVLESEGRVRLLPGMEASPRLGYDVTLLNMHTAQSNIHHQLLDASFAAGAFVGLYHNWVFGVTLGAGYAGDRPFDEGRAWYGKADFLVARKFGDNDALGVGIDYDGHRSYMPDVPLPGFGYSHTFDPHWQVVLGVPLTSITWTPDDKWRLYGDYLLLTDFDFDAGFQFIRHWTIFGSFQTRRDQFYISELHEHTRLLYGQKRLETGLRIQPIESLTFSAAIGYAFAIDFRRGYDYRSSSRYIYSTNEPYIRVGLDMKF